MTAVAFSADAAHLAVAATGAVLLYDLHSFGLSDWSRQHGAAMTSRLKGLGHVHCISFQPADKVPTQAVSSKVGLRCDGRAQSIPAWVSARSSCVQLALLCIKLRRKPAAGGLPSSDNAGCGTPPSKLH